MSTISRKDWKLKKVYLIFFIIFALEVSPAQSPQFEAAKNGFSKYFQNIPAAMKEYYGFGQTDSIQNIHLGEPLKLFQITLSSIENYKEGDSTGSLLSNTDLWYFPLCVNNEIKSFLVVDKIGNVFSAVSFGYASLAREINTLNHQLPASSGYRFLLAVVYQAETFLYTVPELNNRNLTIINSTGSMLQKISVDTMNRTENLSITIEKMKSLISN